MRRLPIVALLPSLLAMSGCASFDSPHPVTRTVNTIAYAPAPLGPAPVMPEPPADIVPALGNPTPAPAPQVAAQETPPATVPSAPVTPPVRDIWARLRIGFVLPRDNSEVRRRARQFALERERTRVVLKRAEPFLCHVVDTIEQRGMPLDFALLPAIESAFDPYAASPSQAAGLWQFLPYTGSRFGLRQNWWYDGRRDVPEATRAALDYLSYLHGMFGDWLLAIAAYNSGEGRVQKLIAEAKAQGRPTDFWSLPLPAETRDYVPKLLGMVELVANPELYGYNLTPLPNEPRIEIVQLPGQVELGLAADMAGLSLDDLHQLNPGFCRWATDPAGPHHLVVPYGRGKSLRAAMAKLPKDSLMRFDRITVQKGEDLESIASAFNVDEHTLRQVNDLKSSKLKAGMRLKIPLAAVGNTMPDETVAASRSKGVTVTYKIRSGDSLWLVARRNSVAIDDLMEWNRLKASASLRPGKMLIIRQDVRATAERTSRRVPVPEMATAPAHGERAVYYRVQNGDTLSEIAERYQVSTRDLMHWNKLSGHRLKIGQKLRVLVPSVRVTAQAGV